MNPEKLESMRLAAELLCCAQKGLGGGGTVFPTSPPPPSFDEDDSEWVNFMNAFFAISDQILNYLTSI